jgi:hypothetical protein
VLNQVELWHLACIVHCQILSLLTPSAKGLSNPPPKKRLLLLSGNCGSETLLVEADDMSANLPTGRHHTAVYSDLKKTIPRGGNVTLIEKGRP